MKVAVCVCTFQRPDGLRNLLQHLALIQWDHELIVIVADNDTVKQEGLAVVNEIATTYRWPVSGYPVPERGFSFSRNTAAAKALQHDPDFVAYIDDDEWPTPEWLEELFLVQQHCDADAVGGPTEPVFPDSATDLQRMNPYFGARLDTSDNSPCQLQATGNCLIRASALRSLGPVFFLPEFALTGGEDLAFFEQFRQSGYSMYWAASALVYESVAEDRLTDSWMKQRVIMNSNTRVRIMRIFYPGLLHASIRVAKTLALLLVASALTAAGIFNPAFADRGRLLRWKFWGKFTAHLDIGSVSR